VAAILLDCQPRRENVNEGIFNKCALIINYIVAKKSPVRQAVKATTNLQVSNNLPFIYKTISFVV
jgi:hypothetical protein